MRTSAYYSASNPGSCRPPRRPGPPAPQNLRQPRPALPLVARSLFQLLALAPLVLLAACKDDVTPDNPSADSNSLYGTGWNNQENFSQTIPVAINYGNYQSSGTLPARVDLTAKFPPIGFQGQVGSCVAWAVGYNTKSYLDGVARNSSSAQLQATTNQYSPADLFFSIDPSNRTCSGTQFDYAFNVLISRGVNTMAAVPYTGQCPASAGSASSAAANKIKNYRRIEGSVNDIKQYLAQGVPVVIGAMVDLAFKQWRGSGVLTSLPYAYEVGGHAMVIAGYDDSRAAFRIINSWDTTWGDNGYAWVGYDFLVNRFCIQNGQRSLFVAFNDNATTTVTPPTTSSSPDLAAFVVSDYSLYPSQSSYTNARRSFFDVKNVGNQTMPAASNWNIYYLWVNAFNANNYGIIFRGEFTTTIPQNTYQNVNSNYARLNYNLAPGASLSQLTAGQPYSNWSYYMPTLTGNYYLVLYIDKGTSTEANQTNNVFYVTQTPKYFANGYSQRTADSLTASTRYKFENLLTFRHKLTQQQLTQETSLLPYQTLSNAEFPNAYTSEEVVSFLEGKIKSGGL